jgi:hypothetical protein
MKTGPAKICTSFVLSISTQILTLQQKLVLISQHPPSNESCALKSFPAHRTSDSHGEVLIGVQSCPVGIMNCLGKLPLTSFRFQAGNKKSSQGQEVQ